MTMGERPSGPVASCGFRLSISLAIPAVVIDMGGIHRSFGIWLGVWSKTLSHGFSCACKPTCMCYKLLNTRSQFLLKTRPQNIY